MLNMRSDLAGIRHLGYVYSDFASVYLEQLKSLELLAIAVGNDDTADGFRKCLQEVPATLSTLVVQVMDCIWDEWLACFDRLAVTVQHLFLQVDPAAAVVTEVMRALELKVHKNCQVHVEEVHMGGVEYASSWRRHVFNLKQT